MTNTKQNLLNLLEMHKNHLVYPEDRINAIDTHMKDFAGYAKKYNKALKKIRELHAALSALGGLGLGFFSSVSYNFSVSMAVASFITNKNNMCDELIDKNDFIQSTLVRQSGLNRDMLALFLTIKKLEGIYTVIREEKINNLQYDVVLKLLPRPLIIKIGEPLKCDDSILSLDLSDIFD
jgi:hypothetical protein